jgi:hypothetical protein
MKFQTSASMSNAYRCDRQQERETLFTRFTVWLAVRNSGCVLP